MKRKFSKCLCIAASLAMLSAAPSVEPIEAANTGDKVIALTFDDGPNTTTTNEVLDILEKYNAKASFFLIGNNINEESAKTVKRAYDMGCEIDNHSRTHSNMGGMSAEEIIAEFDYVDEKVIEIIGEPTKFFRAPFIDVSDTMYEAIDVPFICGIDCQDYMQNVTAEERSDYIINNARDGVMVLLHDASGNDQTVEAIETVIPTLQAQGYEFVTLTELFERQGETPKEDMMYSCMAKYPCSSYELHSNIFTGEAVGDSSWSGWSETASLDRELLKELGDSFAIEVEYQSTAPPVIALQKWSGASIWTTVQPYYFNGDRACFLAEDIMKELEALEVDYTDLDKMTIVPFGGTLTMTKADILVKGAQEETTESTEVTEHETTDTTETEETVKYDVNADGQFDVADIVSMQKFLVKADSLANMAEADVTEDSKINVFDLMALRCQLLSE